jgi:hypothetical protein
MSKKEAGQHVSNDMWILKLRVIFSAENLKDRVKHAGKYNLQN